jgi:hypothetical protein
VAVPYFVRASAASLSVVVFEEARNATIAGWKVFVAKTGGTGNSTTAAPARSFPIVFAFTRFSLAERSCENASIVPGLIARPAGRRASSAAWCCASS